MESLGKKREQILKWKSGAMGKITSSKGEER